MFAFDLLRIALTHSMSRGWQMPFIDAGPSGVKVHQPKGLQQLLSLPKDRSCSTAKRIRQDHARQMINRLPQPALLSFAPDKTPHFLDLCGFHAAPLDRARLGATSVTDAFVHWRETGGFFLIPCARDWGRLAGHA